VSVSADREQDAPVDGPAQGDEPEARPAGRLRAFWSVPTYRFAVLFLVLLSGLALAYPALRLRYGKSFAAFEELTARIVYELVRRVSSEARLDGSIVFLGPFPVAVIDECTGVYEAVLLGAALLAFPTRWTNTALGFLLGFPAIYLMNVARIAMLLFVGRYLPRIFDFMHVYFWQVTMIAMVASVWLAWVLWVVRSDEPREGDAT
jgi:exosortase H (IPTLxxWG-CTERM-specific)